MALQLIPGQIEKFVGVFYRTNVKAPPARPDYTSGEALERMVITKGQLQITMLGNETMSVTIPDDQQVDEETYGMFLNLLTTQIVELLQVPQHFGDILEAMRRGGIVAYFQGPTLRINPLTPGVGEMDQF